MIIINAIKIIFLLGFLVFIHEGGHFLAARIFKVNVEEFSIGFGKKIFSKEKNNTLYSIGCIPFGGYVKMTGENERSSDSGAFNNAKLIHRIIIVAAGAIINIIFAIILYFIISIIYVNNASTIVEAIIPEAKDNLSIIESGDEILELNNEKIRIKADIYSSLLNYTEGEIQIKLKRNDEIIEGFITPLKYNDSFIIGVTLKEIENVSFYDRIYFSFWKTTNFLNSAVLSLKLLFTGKVGINQMTGPIGISYMVSKESGIYNFMALLCMISLSLGITNLLPIPALDGGRIVLLIIEGIRKKPLKEEIELEIQSIGFFFLIGLAIYVSYQDILRFF